MKSNADIASELVTLLWRHFKDFEDPSRAWEASIIAALDAKDREREEAAAAARPALHDALVSVMSEISEEAYAAGWMSGIEGDLWKIVQGGVPASYGMIEVTAQRIATLKALSELLGGWTNGERVVPFKEWATRQAAEGAGEAKNDG